MRRAIPLLILAIVSAAGPVSGQGREAPRTRTTTLAALSASTLFFNRQRVRVQGEVVRDPGAEFAWLTDGVRRIVLADPQHLAEGGSQVDARGTFWDVGRQQQDDSRLPTFDFAALSRAVLNRDWPGPGELLVILVESARRADSSDQASIASLALDPARFEGRRVTVAGRFRGANLYGDLPAGPGKSKWDFVLQAADAAVWVTGLQPKGPTFNLNPSARVDTGRWLRVSGVVRHEGAFVWIEAQRLEAAEADPTEEEKPDEPPAAVFRTTLVTPPIVVFSAPVQDDSDVSSTSTVRIQFSRDMDAASFKDRVTARYFGEAPDVPPPPALTFAYRQATRVLEVRFAAPLERFRTVRIELLDGITSSDKLGLGAWTLSFTIGGR